jgi:hypothetical protein
LTMFLRLEVSWTWNLLETHTSWDLSTLRARCGRELLEIDWGDREDFGGLARRACAHGGEGWECIVGIFGR